MCRKTAFHIVPIRFAGKKTRCTFAGEHSGIVRWTHHVHIWYWKKGTKSFQGEYIFNGVNICANWKIPLILHLPKIVGYQRRALNDTDMQPHIQLIHVLLAWAIRLQLIPAISTTQSWMFKAEWSFPSQFTALTDTSIIFCIIIKIRHSVRSIKLNNTLSFISTWTRETREAFSLFIKIITKISSVCFSGSIRIGNHIGWKYSWVEGCSPLKTDPSVICNVKATKNQFLCNLLHFDATVSCED